MGPLADPFIYKEGEQYLFLLTACARDLLRFQESCYKLLDLVMDDRLGEAKKVDKMNLPEGCEKIRIDKTKFDDRNIMQDIP